jgi:hypothetical protein
MPAQITVSGTFRGRAATVEWRPGVLDGDPFALLEITDAVRAKREVGAAGVAIGPATLDGDRELVVATIASAFDEIESISGYKPQEIPDDAQA